MKEVEEEAPSKFVTPRKKKKRRRTDFNNKKARQRREVRRKQALECNITGSPVKGCGEGLSTKFCSIRKLVLESVDESAEEILEECKEEPHKQKGGSIILNQMSGGKIGSRRQEILSPQPSITRRNPGSVESESKSSKECHSESVSIAS